LDWLYSGSFWIFWANRAGIYSDILVLYG